MRRALGVLGLLSVGLLLGFVARLVWPRPASSSYLGPAPVAPPPVTS